MHTVDRISDLFSNKVVFISGGSGFLGKVLVEKLLRCTKVGVVYLLLRNKKGKTPEERLQDLFENPLFLLLKKENPSAIGKCVAIPGDVSERDLGMSFVHREKLQQTVHFIFHSAATTRFDDTMRYAVVMNTRGTKFMLDLAEQCINLQLFIHVSTAFAFPKENILYERFYDPPADPHAVINSLSWIDDSTMKNMTKKLLGDIPNTYTFTKALAESLVQERIPKIPAVIVRPAVVVPIWKSPIPGWSNNLQGPIGLFVGAGKGVIRSMYMDSESYANLIPADCVVNSMLIIAHHYSQNKEKQVFNLCTPKEDILLSWKDIIDLGKNIVENDIPFNGILWYPGGGFTKSRVIQAFNFWVFQLIPAIFIDFWLRIFGYKPILYNIQMRIKRGGEMFEYYTTKAWDFDTSSVVELRKSMNKIEKEIYKIDSDGLDLREYFINAVKSARRYNLKETDDMLPAARRNMKIMYFVDKFCKIAFFAAIFYYIYNLFIFA